MYIYILFFINIHTQTEDRKATTNSNAFLPSRQQAIVEALPKARLKEVSRAGHAPMLEAGISENRV